MKISIFAPRMDYVPQKDGTLKEVPHIAAGTGNFDEYYIDRELVEVPKPVEGSVDDYILVPKLKESKRSIREVINSQADDVGLDNMIRKYELTGDPSVLPSGIAASDEVLDLTKLPQDNAEYMAYIHNLSAAYEALPIELRKDMSMEEFIKNITPEQVNAYLDSVKPKEEKKDGDK